MCIWFVTVFTYQSHLMLEYSNINIRMLNVMWYHSCMDTRIEHARQFRERSALITMHFFTSREVRFCLERAESSCKSKSLIVIPDIFHRDKSRFLIESRGTRRSWRINYLEVFRLRHSRRFDSRRFEYAATSRGGSLGWLGKVIPY